MTDEQANERPHPRVVRDKADLRVVRDKADFWGRWAAWQANVGPHLRVVWDKADFWGRWAAWYSAHRAAMSRG
jgi:hypothetical protein